MLKRTMFASAAVAAMVTFGASAAFAQTSLRIQTHYAPETVSGSTVTALRELNPGAAGGILRSLLNSKQ